MDSLPTVFISSTFYDLRQIRKDLAQFVSEELGYGFLASEHSSFPVDPDQDTVENCRRRVEQDADILVLVIGGRYGSISPLSDRSVTNIEYLTARGKRLPIFAFVTKDVLALLGTWERNPNADFSAAVDSVRVFEFVKTVRTTDSVWTFAFEDAGDIIKALRVQFAYMMKRGLHAGLKLKGAERELFGLSGQAFRLALEKPDGWAGLLFGELVLAEIASAADLRRQHHALMSTGEGAIIEDADTPRWLKAMTEEARRMVDDFERVIRDQVNQAFSTSETQTIAFGARQVGQMYRDVLAWATRLRKAHLHDDWRPAVLELSTLLDDVLAELEAFGGRLNDEVARVVAGGIDARLTVPLTLHIRETNFNAELEKMRRKRGWS